LEKGVIDHAHIMRFSCQSAGDPRTEKICYRSEWKIANGMKMKPGFAELFLELYSLELYWRNPRVPSQAIRKMNED